MVHAEPVGYSPGPLHALSYVSTPTVPFDDRDLTDLLFAARRVNAHYGVTGKLLVLEDEVSGHVVRFLQWVEGSDAAIEAVYERIEADPRHRVTEVLHHGPIERRRFGEWDMAFGRTSDERAYEEAVAEAA